MSTVRVIGFAELSFSKNLPATDFLVRSVAPRKSAEAWQRHAAQAMTKATPSWQKSGRRSS
jgi:hypothetical protein